MRYLVTNFAYGYGPFLRTTELALALNAERQERGQEAFGIIVPHVYGARQEALMREEFPDAEHLFLDETLGAILRRVFYSDSSYEDALKAFVRGGATASADAQAYLAGVLSMRSLSGEVRTVHGEDIALTLTRSPRVSFGALPAYGATFAHTSDILVESLTIDPSELALDRTLVQEAIPLARALEDAHALVGIAEPATFSYLPDRQARSYEFPVAPTIRIPVPDAQERAPGLYVTVTGIPGLERLYEEARSLDLLLYANEPERVAGSHAAPPSIVGTDAVILPFARAGWGSIWGAMLAGKPIILPPFDPMDDPEILFNNRCVESLDLGIVYRGEPLPLLLERAEALVPGIQDRCAALLERFGTLDGNQMAARRIADALT